MNENQSNQGIEPKFLFKQVINVSPREQVSVEVFDNGAIVTTRLTKAAGLWGGGGGGGGSTTCSGSCGGQTIGPLTCPAGSSPVLDCINHTLTCKATLGRADTPAIFI